MGFFQSQTPPNNACTRLGVRTAFFDMFLAYAESCFEGKSTSHPKRVTLTVGRTAQERGTVNYRDEARKFFAEHRGRIDTPSIGWVAEFATWLEKNAAQQSVHPTGGTYPLEIDKRATLVVTRQYDRNGEEIAISNINVPASG